MSSNHAAAKDCPCGGRVSWSTGEARCENCGSHLATAPPAATDFLVDVGNPAALDATLSALPGVVAQVVGGPDGPFPQEDGHYVVRVFGGETANSMFEFMVGNQGYCTVVGRHADAILAALDELEPESLSAAKRPATEHVLESLVRDGEAPIWTIKCSCGWGNMTLTDHNAVDRWTAHKKEATHELG